MIKGLVFFLIGLSLFSARSLQMEPFYFIHQKISIKVLESSPVYSAFLDTMDTDVILPDSVPAQEGVNLSTEDWAVQSHVNPLDVMVAEITLHSKQEESKKELWQQLESLVISQPSSLVMEETKKQMEQKTGVKFTELAAVKIQPHIQNDFESHPPIEYANKPTIELEESKNQSQENVKWVATQFGGAPIIIRSSQSNEQNLWLGGAPQNSEKEVVSVAAHSPSQRGAQYPLLQGFTTPSQAPEESLKSLGLLDRPYYVSGPLQLIEGMAITGRSEMVLIDFVVGDEIIETGQFDFETAMYSIKVPHLEGLLRVQVRELESGRLLGEGESDLTQVISSQIKNKDEIVDLALRASPVTQRLQYTIKGLRSRSPNQLKFFGYESESIQVFNESSWLENFHKESSLLFSFSQPDHWSTIGFIQPESKNEFHSYSNELLDTLLLQAGLGSSYDKESLGLVWGRVTHNGRALIGATVQVVASHDHYKVVYFDGLVLNSDLKKTSSTGEYVIISSEEGPVTIRVMYQVNGQSFTSEAKVIPVYRKHVSEVDFQMNQLKYSKAFIFNPLQMEDKLSPKIQVFGSEGVFTSKDNQVEISYFSGEGNQSIEMDLGSLYPMTLVEMSKNENFMRIPVLKSEQLQDLIKESGFGWQEDKAVVYGFFSEIFEVHVSKDIYGEADQQHIVYFNSQGQISEEGEAGGGFIVFNIEPGWQNFTLTTNELKPQNKLVNIQPKKAHCLRFVSELL